jgi:hypothetical protein
VNQRQTSREKKEREAEVQTSEIQRGKTGNGTYARRSMMGAQPLEAMRARRARRALSTWRRYSASTTGAAIAGEEERTLEIGGEGGAGCVWASGEQW